MESPLDILSRAAGMVSRNNTPSTIMSTTEKSCPSSSCPSERSPTSSTSSSSSSCSFPVNGQLVPESSKCKPSDQIEDDVNDKSRDVNTTTTGNSNDGSNHRSSPETSSRSPVSKTAATGSLTNEVSPPSLTKEDSNNSTKSTAGSDDNGILKLALVNASSASTSKSGLTVSPPPSESSAAAVANPVERKLHPKKHRHRHLEVFEPSRNSSPPTVNKEDGPENLSFNGNGSARSSRIATHEDYIADAEDDNVPVNLGKRPIRPGSSSPDGSRSPLRLTTAKNDPEDEDVDVVSSDLDRPLDFSMKKLKRSAPAPQDSDSDEESTAQHLFKGHSWRDFKMKRKRPSVISFGTQPPLQPGLDLPGGALSLNHQFLPQHSLPPPPYPSLGAGGLAGHHPPDIGLPLALAAAKPKQVVKDETDPLDVDDHFKKSLGLEFYNHVFAAGKRKPEGRSEKVPVSKRSPPPPVDSKPPMKPKAKSVHDNGTNEPRREVKIEQPTAVDDHFEKALGKSTWLKLQGL